MIEQSIEQSFLLGLFLMMGVGGFFISLACAWWIVDKRVPYELSMALAKAIDSRDFYAECIKRNTDKWVAAQKKIIELNGVIKRLKRLKGELE